jgi:FtsH-binding integral membrane protein
MDTLFGNRKISMKALSDFSNLNKGTKQHLKNVYTSLGLTMLSAAAGALGFFLLQLQVSLLAVLGSIGLLFAIMLTPHTPENVTKRLGIVHICIYIQLDYVITSHVLLLLCNE